MNQLNDLNEIERYADGEMSPEECAVWEGKIASRPELQSHLEFTRSLKSKLAESCPAVNDDELWNECRSRMKRIEESQRVERFVHKYRFALCGALAATIVGVGLFQRTSQSSNLVAANELPSVMAGMSPLPQNQVEQMPWAGLDTSRGQVAIPQDQIIRFFSGNSAQGPMARVDLRDNLGDYTLLVLPSSTELTGLKETTNGRYRIGVLINSPAVSWKENDRAFMLVGNRDPIQLQMVAERLRQSR